MASKAYGTSAFQRKPARSRQKPQKTLSPDHHDYPAIDAI
jgi:hypothetical protein